MHQKVSLRRAHQLLNDAKPWLPPPCFASRSRLLKGGIEGSSQAVWEDCLVTLKLSQRHVDELMFVLANVMVC